jgi:hypothetical protein
MAGKFNKSITSRRKARRFRELTQEFETFALTLMREMPVKKASEILGETDPLRRGRASHTKTHDADHGARKKKPAGFTSGLERLRPVNLSPRNRRACW